MNTTLKQVIVWTLFAAVASAACPEALAGDRPSLRADKPYPIEVTRIQPTQADLRRVERERKVSGTPDAGEPQVHVVKIYIHMPRAGAQGCILFVGDEKIKEYGGFAQGIFFKVYDPKRLLAWAGKPVRAVYKNEETDLNVTMPPKPAKTPPTLPTVGEVLKRGAAVEPAP